MTTDYNTTLDQQLTRARSLMAYLANKKNKVETQDLAPEYKTIEWLEHQQKQQEAAKQG